MPDKILICQNCNASFVYSEYEQARDKKADLPEPLYDPICASIKANEALRPVKPNSKPRS